VWVGEGEGGDSSEMVSGRAWAHGRVVYLQSREIGRQAEREREKGIFFSPHGCFRSIGRVGKGERERERERETLSDIKE